MTSDIPDLLFKVRKAELDTLLSEIRKAPSLEPVVAPSAGAGGGGELVGVLVPLVPAALTFIAAMAATWIKRGATVQLGPLKVTGARHKTVEDLLRRELDQPAPARSKRKTAKRKKAHVAKQGWRPARKKATSPKKR